MPKISNVFMVLSATTSNNIIEYDEKIKNSPISRAFPNDVPMTKTYSIDMTIKSASELTHELRNPTPTSPFHNFRDNIVVALDTLSEIFSKYRNLTLDVNSNEKSTA